MDQSNLFLLIMQHVNIDNCFQEMSESWREGKVLLVFHHPPQRRLYPFPGDSRGWGRSLADERFSRFNRTDQEGASR